MGDVIPKVLREPKGRRGRAVMGGVAGRLLSSVMRNANFESSLEQNKVQ